jgi:hypothetical protein
VGENAAGATKKMEPKAIALVLEFVQYLSIAALVHIILGRLQRPEPSLSSLRQGKAQKWLSIWSARNSIKTSQLSNKWSRRGSCQKREQEALREPTRSKRIILLDEQLQTFLHRSSRRSRAFQKADRIWFLCSMFFRPEMIRTST